MSFYPSQPVSQPAIGRLSTDMHSQQYTHVGHHIGDSASTLELIGQQIVEMRAAGQEQEQGGWRLLSWISSLTFFVGVSGNFSKSLHFY